MQAMMDTSIRSQVTAAVATKVQRINRKEVARQLADAEKKRTAAMDEHADEVKAAETELEQSEHNRRIKAVQVAKRMQADAESYHSGQCQTLRRQLRDDLANDNSANDAILAVCQRIDRELSMLREQSKSTPAVTKRIGDLTSARKRLTDVSLPDAVIYAADVKSECFRIVDQLNLKG